MVQPQYKKKKILRHTKKPYKIKKRMRLPSHWLCTWCPVHLLQQQYHLQHRSREQEVKSVKSRIAYGCSPGCIAGGHAGELQGLYPASFRSLMVVLICTIPPHPKSILFLIYCLDWKSVLKFPLGFLYSLEAQYRGYSNCQVCKFLLHTWGTGGEMSPGRSMEPMGPR